MFLRYTGLFAWLGLLSLSLADTTTSVTDGITGSNLNQPTFVHIGTGHYYIETQLGLGLKNWFSAYEYCRQIGAELLSFETVEEWHLVNQYLNDRKIIGIFWTAGNDLAIQGKFVWFSTGKPLTLPIWYPGEPNNWSGNERCVEFGNWPPTIYLLNDKECYVRNNFICKASQQKAT